VKHQREFPQSDKDAHTAAEDVISEDIRSKIRETHTEGYQANTKELNI